MENTIVIPDIHGKDIWKMIVKNHPEDQIVFLGDYFDAFDVSQGNQILNFEEILKFRDENKERVVLLTGNHDYHYLETIDERYSGFSSNPLISQLVTENYKSGILQMAFELQTASRRFLFTHAGVSSIWLNDIRQLADLSENTTISEEINQLFLIGARGFFGFVGYNIYGDSPESSPIWIRPPSLHNNGLSSYTHVVGHTQVHSPKIVSKESDTCEIILTDCLNSKHCYVCISNNTGKIDFLDF
jgi:predicted MPP superfamily phosphohydrolase